MITIAVKSTL